MELKHLLPDQSNAAKRLLLAEVLSEPASARVRRDMAQRAKLRKPKVKPVLPPVATAPQEVKPVTPPVATAPQEVKPVLPPVATAPQEVKPLTPPVATAPQEVKPLTPPVATAPQEVKPVLPPVATAPQEVKPVTPPVVNAPQPSSWLQGLAAQDAETSSNDQRSQNTVPPPSGGEAEGEHEVDVVESPGSALSPRRSAPTRILYSQASFEESSPAREDTRPEAEEDPEEEQ